MKSSETGRDCLVGLFSFFFFFVGKIFDGEFDLKKIRLFRLVLFSWVNLARFRLMRNWCIITKFFHYVHRMATCIPCYHFNTCGVCRDFLSFIPDAGGLALWYIQ